MEKENVLVYRESLQEIADAIRTKNGASATYKPGEMGDAIKAIPTQGLDTSDATATAEDIIMNKTAYVNGEKIEGTIYPVYDTYYNTRSKEITVSDTDVIVSSSTGDGYYSVHNTDINMIVPFANLANAIELTGDKLVKGNTILGIEGTYESSSKVVNPYATLEELQAKMGTEGEIGVVVTTDGYDGTYQYTDGAWVEIFSSRRFEGTLTPENYQEALAISQNVKGDTE